MNWREFWNGTHSIYVSERHRDLHYRTIAGDIVALLPGKSATVLDYGCGEAGSADAVAKQCGRLILFDTATTVVARLRERFGGSANIVVCDEAGIATLAPASIDIIVANSLIQYLTREEFARLLDLWRGLLRPGGTLVVADVIPADSGALSDTLALLAFGLRGGFLIDALKGLVATFFSDYRKLRQDLGLSRYAEADMLALLRQHGFSARRSPRNIGHNQSRMLFLAQPA